MTEEYAFLLNKINMQGLSNIGSYQSELQERRILEIYESAEEIADRLLDMYDNISISEMLTLLSESLSLPSFTIHNFALKNNLFAIDKFRSSTVKFDKIIFSDLLMQILKSRGIDVCESSFLQVNKFEESFTYVKNPLSDEAYDVFCQAFKDPRLKYSASIKEAVDLVSNEVVNYALLPLEETGGERLHLASELIFKRDLKINSVTPVFGIDGSVDMKYALVSRGFTIPEINAEDDLYLEIRAVSDSVDLCELLFAAEYFGSSVYRINTLYFGTEANNEKYYSVVFKSNIGSFSGLLGYLTLFISPCTPVGIYKNLE